MANTSVVLEDEPLICHSIYNGYIGINVHSKHWVTGCAWFKVINHPLPFLHVFVERTLICDFRLVIVYRNIVAFSIWITLSSYFIFYIRDPFDIVHVYIVTFKSKSSCYHSGDRAPPPPPPPAVQAFFHCYIKIFI